METHTNMGKEEIRVSLRQRVLNMLFPSSIFSEQVGTFLVAILVFILPIFPQALLGSSAEYSKILFFQAGTLFAAFLMIGGYLRQKELSFPRSGIFYISWLLAAFFILAGAFSPVPRVSFFGVGDELGTTVMMVLSFGVLLISSILFRKQSRAQTLVLAFVASLTVVSFAQALHIKWPQLFGGMNSLVGTSGDLAIFMGGFVILCLSFLYFYADKRSWTLIAYGALIYALLLLIAVDSRVVWSGLSLILIFWLWAIARDVAGVLRVVDPSYSRMGAYATAIGRTSRTTLLILLISIYFAVSAGGAKNIPSVFTASVRKVMHIDVSQDDGLGASETFTIARHALADAPLLGVGPNQFNKAFLRYKDSSVNSLSTWGKSYDVGFGYIPTFLVTTGLIGGVLLLIFVLGILLSSRYLHNTLVLDRSTAFLTVTLYLLATFFFLFLVFETPGVAVFVLSFIFIGAFVAALGNAGLIPLASITSSDKRYNTLLSALAWIKLVAVILVVLILAREAVAYRHYALGKLAVVRGDLLVARTEISRAHALFPVDAYARDISVLALVELNTSAQVGGLTTDAAKKHALDIARVAAIASDEAIRLDPTRSKNYVQRGAVYEALAVLGSSDAFRHARDAYANALTRDPTSPEVMYYAGRVELAAGDTRAAIEWFKRALDIRPNHKGALAALISIYSDSGDIEAMRTVLLHAVTVDDSDSASAFALGKLYYNELSFTEAKKMFAIAVRADPEYADARFYLAASAFRAGEKDYALKQFRIIRENNPDHELLNQVIGAIEQGIDPFVENPYGTTNN